MIYKNKLLLDWGNINCGEIKYIGEENNIPIIDIEGDFIYDTTTNKVTYVLRNG